MEGFPEELDVPEFQSYLLSQLRQLQEEGVLCDVRLTAGLGAVAAHRVVLMATSPTLRSRLSKHLSTEIEDVHFDDIPLVLLETVVRYLYTGSLVVCHLDVEQLLKFCDELGLTHAVDACKNYIIQTATAEAKQVSVEDEEVDSKDGLKELITVNENVIVSGIKILSPKGRKGRRTVLTPRKRTGIVSKTKSETIALPDEGSPANTDSAPAKRKRGRPSVKKVDKPSKNTRKRKAVVVKSQKVVKTKKKKVKYDDSKAADGTIASTEPDGEDKDSEMDGEDISDIDDTKAEDLDDNDYIVKPKKKRIWKRRIRHTYPCSACAKKLSNQKRLAFHEYTKHDIPFDSTKFSWFPCKKEGCTYVAANRHNLDTHMKSRHGVLRPHICEFCGKAFKLPNVLATHINIHTGSKIFHCEQCGQQFNQQSGLDVHVKRHHAGESTWVEMCHICSEKFLQKSDLAWHLFKAHDQPLPERYKAYICDICNFKTKKIHDIRRHMNAHKGIKEHPCPICPKHCKTKSELKRHIGFHGEKSFKCTFEGCSFACTDSIGLGKHVHYMHTHRNYKPYVCPVCHYKTGVKGNQDKHIRTVHDLIVVAKHTVPLKMKFKNFQSGDVITKDGRLVATAIERKKLNAQECLPAEDDDDISFNMRIKNSPKSPKKKRKCDMYDEPRNPDMLSQNQTISSDNTPTSIATLFSMRASPIPDNSDDRQFTILDNYMHSQASRNTSQSKTSETKSDNLPPQLSAPSDSLQSDIASNSENLLSKMPGKSENLQTQMPARAENLLSQMPSRSEELRSQMPVQSAGLRSQIPASSEHLQTQLSSQSLDLRSQIPASSEHLQSQMSSQSLDLRSQIPASSEHLQTQLSSQSLDLRSQIPTSSEHLQSQMSSQSLDLRSQIPTSSEHLQSQMSSQSLDLRSQIPTSSEHLQTQLSSQSLDLRSQMSLQPEDLRQSLVGQMSSEMYGMGPTSYLARKYTEFSEMS